MTFGSSGGPYGSLQGESQRGTSWYISDTLTANNMVYLEGGQAGHGQLVQGLHMPTWQGPQAAYSPPAAYSHSREKV
jgi:hypothetical protein